MFFFFFIYFSSKDWLVGMGSAPLSVYSVTAS